MRAGSLGRLRASAARSGRSAKGARPDEHGQLDLATGRYTFRAADEILFEGPFAVIGRWHATGNRALSEDVAQDTFVTAWRQLAALRDVERLLAWLCGIARNLARKARRRRGRETVLDDHDVAAVDSIPPGARSTLRSGVALATSSDATRPSATGAGSANHKLDCATVAQHWADMMIQIQPDLLEGLRTGTMTSGQVAKAV